MRLSEFFPTYPIQIVTPRGSKVRIATRKIYVDLPMNSGILYQKFFQK